MTETKDEYREAVSEVLEILQFADEEIINKIPLEVLKKLNSQKSITYIPKFKETQKIEVEQISKKAKAILALLYRDYICTKEERKEFDKQLIEANTQNQENMDYSIKRFHDNTKDTKLEFKNALPVEVKKNFIQRILEKLFK